MADLSIVNKRTRELTGLELNCLREEVNKYLIGEDSVISVVLCTYFGFAQIESLIQLSYSFGCLETRCSSGCLENDRIEKLQRDKTFGLITLQGTAELALMHAQGRVSKKGDAHYPD